MHAMTIRLFAYGTLQVGHEASRRLDVVDSVPGRIEGFALFDSGLGWPFACRGHDREQVHGQILTLAGDGSTAQHVARAFAGADEWEGFDPSDPAGSPYLREQVEASTVRGEQVWVHVYLSSEERLRRRYRDARVSRIETGVWVIA